MIVVRRLAFVLFAGAAGLAVAEEPQTPPAEPTAPTTPAAPAKPADSLKPADKAKPAKPAVKGKPDNKMEEIVVNGNRFADTDARRFSTAAKMVFGRDELDRYGDSSVGEVLKRLPGITISGAPGRGGDIRMRGLGKGYTLILINGEPVPRGFSLDSLAPEQIERIEIMRAPVAEHSARAIAGTINIVLREDYVKKGNEARPSLGWEAGYFEPGVSLQRSDNLESFNYNVVANLLRRDLPTESTTHTVGTSLTTGLPVLVQDQQDQSHSISDGIHLNGRINWRLGGGDTFIFQPFLMKSNGHTSGTTQIEQSVGAVPAPYAFASYRTDTTSDMVRGMGNLRLKLADNAKLELRFNAGRSTSDSETTKLEDDATGALAHTIQTGTGIVDTSYSTAGKYSKPIGKDHQFGAGWEIETGNRVESAHTIQDGFNPLAIYGDSIQAKTRRLAAYAQDEWNITPLWAVYTGLRWESIRTESDTALESVQNISRVLSPLFQSLWRFSTESKDQIRFAVTRTYRSPTLGNLVAVPVLASNYPASGPNTPSNADSVGNPNLKPELATGFDLAYEHYFEAGGLLSASTFLRNISNLIRNVSSLETVTWSPVQRWVTTPQNFDHATTHGIELEAKFGLDELMEGAPKLDLRANLSHFWSNVQDLPGPNNRLDQQPKQTANLGADYRLRSIPLTLGANLNWTGAFIVQQATNQIYYQGIKRVVDVYALYRFNPDTQLRFSIGNWLHADYVTASREIFTDTDQTAQNVRKTYPPVALRLEAKF